MKTSSLTFFIIICKANLMKGVTKYGGTNWRTESTSDKIANSASGIHRTTCSHPQFTFPSGKMTHPSAPSCEGRFPQKRGNLIHGVSLNSVSVSVVNVVVCRKSLQFQASHRRKKCITLYFFLFYAHVMMYVGKTVSYDFHSIIFSLFLKSSCDDG